MTPTELLLGEEPIIYSNDTNYNYKQIPLIFERIGAQVIRFPWG